MRTNLRIQFGGGANYYKLLELARMIESKNFHEDAKLNPNLPIKKVKPKLVLLPLIIQLNKFSNYKVQLKALLNCYRVVDKIPNHNRFHNLYHNLCKTTLILCHKVLKTKTLLNLKVLEEGLEAEVVEVEVEVEEV